MSDTEADAPSPPPAALAADVGGYMDLYQDLQEVPKTALIKDGLSMGVIETTALDKRQAHLCALANSVDVPSYVELIEAGCAEHGINLLKVDDAKQLGERAGLCKLDREGKSGQVNACGVVKDYGMETPAFDGVRDYFKSNFLHDRQQRDGLENAPGLDQLQEPGAPKGPSMEHVREIARALKCIGDDLDRDRWILEHVREIARALKCIGDDLDRDWWILERGGREANREYFGSCGKQFALVMGASVAACAGVLLYRIYMC